MGSGWSGREEPEEGDGEAGAIREGWGGDAWTDVAREEVRATASETCLHHNVVLYSTSCPWRADALLVHTHLRS
jgi:hypothetical protein